ncbi:hypothetical protein EYF80_015750 [Liparis tanakae]|uniref:Uncharacterized protein n=1 Tax=Liparis tanakae TaxID=230148 RepID=A0A4Z2I7T9_9TELE|nr:hypothetical protein EYF80_015750 [Liparis tanakae]
MTSMYGKRKHGQESSSTILWSKTKQPQNNSQSMSGRVETTAQARPTNSATTRFTTIQGRRICCSEPGGLEEG